MFIFYQLLFTFSFLFHAFTQAADIEYGVLVAETSSDKENFCIIYFKEFLNLPSKKSDARFHILKDDSDKDWCDDHPESDIKSKVLLLTNGNCSITTQASNVFDRGGEGILFITPSGRVNDRDVNATIAENINMTVALISENSAERLKKMQDNVSVLLFAPHDEGFDYSLLVIWVIAVFALAVGSYWSGLIRFAIYCKEMNSLPGGAREFPNKPSVTVNNLEDSSINVSPFAIAGFVTCMGVMLLLLYFFFAYLVYFIIALFVLASILSVHSCLEVLVLKIQLSCCKAQFRCGAKSCNIDFRQVLLVAFAFAISIYWVIIRKEKGAWILQDILGTSFSIHMLKSIRLSSFKICSILLILLFFYDIFFVFITPLLTGKAESVMEEVATGAGSNSEESLPMVIKVPHFGFSTLSICYQQYSILGLGDILVPGLLVSYCHGFDLVSNKKKLYYFTTVTAYGIGLLVTFVGLFLMNTAQPALLYLVPCTLLPPAMLGWCRGEFSALWYGFRMGQPANASQFPEVQVEDNAPSADTHEESSVLPQTNHSVQKDINLMKDNTTTTDRINLLQ